MSVETCNECGWDNGHHGYGCSGGRAVRGGDSVPSGPPPPTPTGIPEPDFASARAALLLLAGKDGPHTRDEDTCPVCNSEDVLTVRSVLSQAEARLALLTQQHLELRGSYLMLERLYKSLERLYKSAESDAKELLKDAERLELENAELRKDRERLDDEELGWLHALVLDYGAMLNGQVEPTVHPDEAAAREAHNRAAITLQRLLAARSASLGDTAPSSRPTT